MAARALAGAAAAGGSQRSSASASLSRSSVEDSSSRRRAALGGRPSGLREIGADPRADASTTVEEIMVKLPASASVMS